MRLSKVLSVAAARSGYVFSPHWHVQTLLHATLLRRLFAEYQVDCVFDVGANKGQYREFLREDVGFGGLILSFEPVGLSAEICKVKSATDPNWRVFDIALGGKDGEIPINVAENDDLSSFLESRTDQPFGAESKTRRKELVKVRTLDSMFPELQQRYGFSRPYLKLDTQGYDLAIIEHGTKSLASFCGMQTELSLIPIYEAMPYWLDVIAVISKLGFDIAGLFPVARTPDHRVMEFDGVFVSNSPATAALR